MKTVQLDNQLITPSKVVCIGRNYAGHIAELGNEVPEDMVVFIKPNSAISSELSAFHQEELHYEGEICFIYQRGKFGAVGFGLDLTKRGLQSKLKAKGLPWERAKSFNGAAVFSDFVAIDNIDDSLSLELTIDDRPAQSGGIALMLYQPAQILEELQSFIDLEDGDIVMTGTPKGVGVIQPGARFDARVLRGEQVLIAASWIAQ